MKKKLPVFSVDPFSCSLVHPSPAAQDEDVVASAIVSKAKVMESSGVARSPRDCHEVDHLRRRTQTAEGSSSCAPNNEDADKALAFPLPFHRANQKPSCTEMITVPGSSPTSCRRPQHNPLVKAAIVQELASPRWAPKLFRFKCLADMSLMLDSVSGHRNSPQLRLQNVRGSKPSATLKQKGSSPTTPPPLSEKHYLPSPRKLQALPVAHPLPPLSRSPPNEQASPLNYSKVDVISKQTVPCNLTISNECSWQEAKTLPSPMEKSCVQGRALSYNLPSLNCEAHEGRALPSQLAKSGTQGRAVPYNLPNGKECGAQDVTAFPSPTAKLGIQERSLQKSASEPPNCQYNESTARRSPSLSSFTRHSPKSSSCGSLRSSPGSPLHSPLPQNLCPRKWQKGAVLGQGTFGIVYEGFNLEDGSFFAVKVSSSSDLSPEIQQEVDVLSKLEHPNIVRYLGSSIEDGRLCIFTGLVRMGSLEAILRKYKQFEDNTIRSYTRQILLGLEYLHAKKTMHRDIKCGNILVDVNGQVKLSDFGVAKEVDKTLASSLKGTPRYMAPEVLTPQEDCYSFPADIWSLGCTVFEMADGKPPWSNLQGFGFLFKVKQGELPPLPYHLSSEGKDFIRRCLKFHAKDRPTALELLQHPFVGNASIRESFFPRAPPSSPKPKSPLSLSPSLNGRDHGDTHLPTLELPCSL